MGGLYGKSMTSPRQIPGSPSRLRAQHRKLTAMRYYGNVMTTTIWRLRILHLQQYSRRLNLFVCFFLENLAVFEIMWKKPLTAGQMTIRRMRITCWVPNATNTHTICYIYCFTTTTMVARTRLNVTLHVHCLSCLPIIIFAK